ncbi:MAG: dihydrofolate reductase family protein [Candidatus Dormibacteria bacterium]
MTALEPLLEFLADGGPALPLPDGLATLYGGNLSLDDDALYANFVQSIDGVVSLPGVASSGSVISGRHAADRFVMALLRACADAVLVGGGTLRDTPRHHWTAEHVFPEMAEEFSNLRQLLGLPPQPRLVVLTATGEVDVNHPAVQGGATFLTTAAGGRRIRELIPERSSIKDFPGSSVPLAEGVQWLRGEGYRRILSEAGPHVLGQLVDEGLVRDIFLSVSPILAGRQGAGRLSLVEGIALAPERRVETRLASGRRGGDFLLLRYALE